MFFIARGRGVVHWLLSLMTNEVFFFRLGFLFQFLLYLMNRWTCKLGFDFLFFFLRICGFATICNLLGLLYLVFFL